MYNKFSIYLESLTAFFIAKNYGMVRSMNLHQDLLQTRKELYKTIEIMQNAFGDEVMGNTQNKAWYKRLKNGSIYYINSDSRSGLQLKKIVD